MAAGSLIRRAPYIDSNPRWLTQRYGLDAAVAAKYWSDGRIKHIKRTRSASTGREYDAASIGRPGWVDVVAADRLLGRLQGRAVGIHDIDTGMGSLNLPDTAIFLPSGLQKGCAQLPPAVICRPSDPSGRESDMANLPVPWSQEIASVSPSGDHQGCRLSPG
jgi:hypothetical protein